MSDLAELLLAIAGLFTAITSGVAVLITSIRGSRREAERAADRALEAALATDTEQDTRLAQIEKLLKGDDDDRS